jgi:23S rRNA pseudouridine2457 synthase
MILFKMEVHVHFKLYKPFGYLSQFESNARHQKNSRFLGDLFAFPDGVMAIGRLDKDSEGLLLLTTDGQVSYDISSNSVEKEYYTQVDGLITDVAIAQLQRGVNISIEGTEYTTNPCKAERIQIPELPERAKKIRNSRHGETSWVSITITEGKFRQVRKMTAVVGFPTLRLVRVRIGNNLLEDMQPSDVVQVESFDL